MIAYGELEMTEEEEVVAYFEVHIILHSPVEGEDNYDQDKCAKFETLCS
jgi:hypothetical protein